MAKLCQSKPGRCSTTTNTNTDNNRFFCFVSVVVGGFFFSLSLNLLFRHHSVIHFLLPFIIFSSIFELGFIHLVMVCGHFPSFVSSLSFLWFFGVMVIFYDFSFCGCIGMVEVCSQLSAYFLASFSHCEKLETIANNDVLCNL